MSHDLISPRTVKPTLPETVTPDTPLEELNLNWGEKDLPERVRTKHVHRLHPYLGKFIPQLVEIFLRKYFQPGERVYDPFCGSGTTLVEATTFGTHAIGCDIAAFNVLLSRVKTRPYDPEVVRQEVLDILEKVTTWSRGLYQRLLDLPAGWDEASIYLQTWYAPQALRELLLYRALIPRYTYQDLLKIILSRAARSARLTTHFDLDFPKTPQREPYYCYKHQRVCKPVQEALKFLRRYSLDTIRRIEQYMALRRGVQVDVLHGDARTVKLPHPIDGVITSPPYVGLIDYHEQHRYAYELLQLPLRATEEIGAAAKGASKSAKTKYKEDMVAAFANTARFLKPGGYVIVVVRDTQNLYTEIAKRTGFEVLGHLRREVNRRTGRRATPFYEDVFIWRKA
ncbi:MAG TPA: class I SAM-dependent methyltransferase [Anaerolineales bacterium]|nr:class I SAM-dependent methyltransferase [Anaerolineales bacterium]